ncbi:CRE-FIGL-1 protein [Aphelenchoides avenae]|nr:CRE-FIGL-1 protein [Aphelenchus avenae]
MYSGNGVKRKFVPVQPSGTGRTLWDFSNDPKVVEERERIKASSRWLTNGSSQLLLLSIMLSSCARNQPNTTITSLTALRNLAPLPGTHTSPAQSQIDSQTEEKRPRSLDGAIIDNTPESSGSNAEGAPKWSETCFKPPGLSSFSAASGRPKLIKEVRPVVTDATRSPPPYQKPDIVATFKRSNMPPPNSEPAFMPSSVIAPADTNESELKSHPLLKNTDSQIVDIIESEIISSINDMSWDDIAGLETAKKTLKEIIVLPFRRPQIFTGIRAPPKGVLLFGPPGTGKTLIGKCVAKQCNATFFNISASSLTSKWIGECEKLVRTLFIVARIRQPSIDSLLSIRRSDEHESTRRLKTELLVQMDGVATGSDERLLVLGATNKPSELDEAARRRFVKRLYIPLPDDDARKKIVLKELTGPSHAIDEAALEKIAARTEGYSGADVYELCKEASMGPIRDLEDSSTMDIETVELNQIRPITLEDFEAALDCVKPTVHPSELLHYEQWTKDFGCRA